MSIDLAEEVVDLVKKTNVNAFNESTKDLATKQDLSIVESRLEVKIAQLASGFELKISQVESGLEAKISQVESGLEAKIYQVKVDLIKWIVTLILAQTGILAALIKFL